MSFPHPRLLDLANKNIGCPAKSGFQINNRYFLSINMSHMSYS